MTSRLQLPGGPFIPRQAPLYPFFPNLAYNSLRSSSGIGFRFVSAAYAFNLGGCYLWIIFTANENSPMSILPTIIMVKQESLSRQLTEGCTFFRRDYLFLESCEIFYHYFENSIKVCSLAPGITPRAGLLFCAT